MANIMILETDLRLGHHMRTVLQKAGHHCVVVEDISQAQTYLQGHPYMLAIINARFPWTEGSPLLKQLAEKGWPVLFITSDPANQAHLQVLYQGHSRVLVGPFDGYTLTQAVGHLLYESKQRLTYGSLQLNLTEKQVLLDGRPLCLTAQEFALLEALMQSPDTALSREQLLRTAWGYKGIGETRTVDVHVQRLRKKLGVNRIETVYKLGYRLKMA